MWLSQGSFIYLQQVKQTGDLYSKFCLGEGGLAITYLHYLVNYMLISSLQLGTLIRLLTQFRAGLQNTMLHFNISKDNI